MAARTKLLMRECRPHALAEDIEHSHLKRHSSFTESRLQNV